MQPYILGIDIGTGSTKAVAVNYSGAVLTTSQFHYPTMHPQVDYSEQDPEVIWQAFTDCVQEVIKKLQNPPVAISLSSAMHSLLCVDEKGVALYPMITWADTRSAAIAERLKNSPDAENIYGTTGTPIHTMSPLSKIIWIREHNPSLFAQTKKFISIKEYIWFKLFGVYQIDYSIASATGLFHIEALAWNKRALELAGIGEDQLSSPVDTACIRNDLHPPTALLLNLPLPTKFIIGGSDGCLANVGSFALEPGVAALTIGTSGAVRMMSKQPIINFPAMTFNYLLQKDVFICGGPVNNGGNVMAWVLKNLLHKKKTTAKDYASFFDEIETIPSGCHGLLFLPYLTGERAPVWDAKSCGVYFGIKPHHTQSYFLRAAIEGVCYALNDVLQLVENSAEPIHQINVSGGFVHSKAWMQILADITGKTVHLIQTEDASAVGAAYFALKCMNQIEGYKAFYKEAQITIEPQFSRHQIYKEYFTIYKNLYPSLSTAMHQLYTIKQDY